MEALYDDLPGPRVTVYHDCLRWPRAELLTDDGGQLERNKRKRML